MARYISPYTSIRGNVNLLDTLLSSEAKKGQEGVGISRQKKKMKDAFLEEQKKLKARAEKKAGKWMGIDMNVLKAAGMAASMFGGPLVSAAVNFATTGIEKNQQKKALEGLLKFDKGRWGKTFLTDASSQFYDAVEDKQIKSSDVFTDALIAGIKSGVTSGKMGGPDGLGKNITDARKAAAINPTGGITPAKAGWDELITGVKKFGTPSSEPLAFDDSAKLIALLGTLGLE
tara:strand:- start:9258 stop:9950 length:693 start_codon:yes stop_codon:yes gene_type:complete